MSTDSRAMLIGFIAGVSVVGTLWITTTFTRLPDLWMVSLIVAFVVICGTNWLMRKSLGAPGGGIIGLATIETVCFLLVPFVTLFLGDRWTLIGGAALLGASPVAITASVLSLVLLRRLHH